jgi:homocysteine S-methyltransferase
MSFKSIEHRLTQQPYLIIDGGLATQLEQRGYALDGDLWSARALFENPEIIVRVHEDFIEAGADILITASYQASFDGFSRCGFSPQTSASLFQNSVHLARRAAHGADASTDHCIVAASIGSIGATLEHGAEYVGDFGLTEEELIEFHAPRIEALTHARPDLFACETLPSLLEARALVRILSSAPHIPAWLSFTCANDATTCEGDAIEACAALAEASPSVVAVGINCTAPRFCENLLLKMQKETAKPLVVYPNSGEQWNPNNQSWGIGPKDAPFSKLKTLLDAGARLIGGCCRVSPDDIRPLKKYRASLP